MSQPTARFPWALLIGYLLLVISLTGLDQVTKMHVERDLMSRSHSTDVRIFGANPHHVATWGMSPAQIRESGLDPRTPTTSTWLDFHLTYTRNTGAAWSALADLPNLIRVPLLVSATLIAIGVVGYLFRKSHPGQRLLRTALALILSGALGNFIDRVWLGYVIDWLQFDWNLFGWEYRFPVFNVADMAINLGVVLFLIDMMISERKTPKRALS